MILENEQQAGHHLAIGDSVSYEGCLRPIATKSRLPYNQLQ
jgi:hypothetical protein